MLLPSSVKGTTKQDASLGNIINALNKYSPNEDHSIKTRAELATVAEKAMRDGATGAGQFLATFALNQTSFNKLAGLDGKSGIGSVDFAKLAESGGDVTNIDAEDFTKTGISFTAKDFTSDDLDKVAGTSSSSNDNSTVQLLLQILLLILGGNNNTQYPAATTNTSSNPLYALLGGLLGG